MDSLDLLRILVQKTSAVPGVCLLVTRVRHGLAGPVSAEDLSSSLCVFWLPGSDVDSLGLLVQKTSTVHICVSSGYQGQTWTYWA